MTRPRPAEGDAGTRVEALAAVARKVAEEPPFREALARSGLGHAFAEAGAFDAAAARDCEASRGLVARLNLT